MWRAGLPAPANSVDNNTAKYMQIIVTGWPHPWLYTCLACGGLKTAQKNSQNDPVRIPEYYILSLCVADNILLYLC